jgi:ATP phosphoribosyltransferase regulatory subunit
LYASLKDGISAEAREGLKALLQLYGDEKVLAEAERVLPPSTGLKAALAKPQMAGGPHRRRKGRRQGQF